MSNKDISYQEILASKYYDYYKDNEYILYDVREFYYPYFKIISNCVFRKKNQISLIEEMFLKAISCGIKEYSTLEIFLGIDKEVFEEVAGRLHLESLFIEEPSLILTPKGQKILDDGEKLETSKDENILVLDGITGEVVQTNNTTDERRKNNSAINIRVQIPYPTNENLDRTIRNKALQTILFESISKKDTDNRKIYEIKDINENPYKFHKKFDVLFFKNSDNPKKVLVVSNGNPDDTMTNLVNKIEREGKVLFDFAKVEQEHKELEKQITIYDYSEINFLSNGSQIGTYEHPKFFDYALRYATKEIIIISPWIKWIVIKNKTQDIRNALEKGVKISFFYGMGKDTDIDSKSKDFLERMTREYPQLLKFARTNQHDHSKIIICDRDWMVTTSFNWTSFKGDENIGDRRGERGSFINKKSEISKIVGEYL